MPLAVWTQMRIRSSLICTTSAATVQGRAVFFPFATLWCHDYVAAQLVAIIARLELRCTIYGAVNSRP